MNPVMLPATPTRRSYTRQLMSDRFSNRTGPVWQRLGPIHSVDEGVSARDAMEMHGLLANYLEVPSFYRNPKTGLEESAGLKTILREKRSGDLEYMATVNETYEIIQPADIAAMLDTAPPSGGPSITGLWPVDTIGLQHNNGGFFITLHAGGYDVGGDQMEKYFLIKNGNDGSTGLNVAVIHIRLKCWNTMSVALKESMIAFTIPHRKDANKLLRCYTQMITSMPRAQATVEAAMQALAAKKLTKDDVDAILEKTFALPKLPQNLRAYQALQTNGATIDDDTADTFTKSALVHERKIAHALEERRMVATLHEQFNDENGVNANTGWSIFNAITDLLDNKAGKGATDDRLDDAARESLFGNRARQRELAYSAIIGR